MGLAAAAWTKCLSFTLKFLCDGQGAVRRAILYHDRSCLYHINPIELRKTKTVYSFGLSECNRVKSLIFKYRIQ